MKSLPTKPRILVRPRIHIGDDITFGPGKIEMLRMVDTVRSITGAAKALKVPYKRAWLLIDSLNKGFGRPVVETATGGRNGGGTTLTPLGQQLIELYDALEDSLNTHASKELQALHDLAEPN